MNESSRKWSPSNNLQRLYAALKNLLPVNLKYKFIIFIKKYLIEKYFIFVKTKKMNVGSKINFKIE